MAEQEVKSCSPIPRPRTKFSGRLLRPARWAVSLVAAATFALTPGVGASDAEPLAWKPCGQGFECTTLTVPFQDAVLGGDTLSIPLVRHAATRPGERLGVLLYNPGGPGIPGTDFLVAFIGAFPAAIQERFDIVSFDPRGTGKAGNIDCGTDVASLFAVDPTGADGQAATAWSGVAAACAEHLGDHLGDYSTVTTTRDIDRIRDALGEDRSPGTGAPMGRASARSTFGSFPIGCEPWCSTGPWTPRHP